MTEKYDRGLPISNEDNASLDTLYRSYAGWLTRVLRRTLGHHADAAEDLVQEAYIRVARYQAVDANRNPRGLLRQIGVNLARDHMRRSIVRSRQFAADEQGSESIRNADWASQEADVILKQIVLALPPLYRDVFVLSRFTGLTYPEIGRHLGISVKTVEWRMTKALSLCAERMRA